MPFALVVLVLAAAWRIFTLQVPGLSNFSPLMALAFCGGVYFRGRWLWIVPVAALTLSDLYIDHYYATQYHYEWTLGGAVVRALCFVAAAGFGRIVAQRRNWLNLFSGALGGSLLFYLVTNSASWLGDAGYAHNAAGWWQAMTIGHPQFQPTLFFFRNTLVSDLLFTGAFALAMEALALRRGESSLLETQRAA